MSRSLFENYCLRNKSKNFRINYSFAIIKNRVRHYTKRVAFWEYVNWLCFLFKGFFKNGFRKTLVSRQYLLNATNERTSSKAAEENREEHILKQLKYTLKKLWIRFNIPHETKHSKSGHIFSMAFKLRLSLESAKMILLVLSLICWLMKITSQETIY